MQSSLNDSHECFKGEVGNNSTNNEYILQFHENSFKLIKVSTLVTNIRHLRKDDTMKVIDKTAALKKKVVHKLKSISSKKAYANSSLNKTLPSPFKSKKSSSILSCKLFLSQMNDIIK